jgi:uncharacterized membrane protein YraQ (UPF0718 family)
MTAIILATVIGAFSPFCSCGVIPVVASLLIGGVPLAPVMAFWIASPLMDPEIFFLSVATLGWELAVWRLASAVMLSLVAGFITHAATKWGWLGAEPLRIKTNSPAPSLKQTLKKKYRQFKSFLERVPPITPALGHRALVPQTICCSASQPIDLPVRLVPQPESEAAAPRLFENNPAMTTKGQECGCVHKAGFWFRRLARETWMAAFMVLKFMSLAFFLEAIIILFIPSSWISSLLGTGNSWSIILAAVLGVPAYTSNLTALPLVSGLIAQGMNPAAGLAFLIAGPTTTLPAMAAVRGLVSRRVFWLYISFSLIGAIFFGYIYELTLIL